MLTSGGRPEYLAATVSGLLDDGADGVSVHVDRSGSSAQGLRDVFAAARGDGDLLYFEDDVQLATGAVAAMLAMPVPAELGFLSFCDIGWVPGNQALKVPERTLWGIQWPEPWGPYSSDVMLRTAVRRWGQVRPSIVKHVGLVSTIDYSRVHRREWETWDFVPDARDTELEIVDRYFVDPALTVAPRR